MRVSTNAEEQLQSFKSQKEYYQDKISANKEWALVGIYADEGITGTKTTKRDEFLRMIDDCMNGLVDIVITKSVSRFSRNLVDVLSYTRMLKAKGVTVIFEKENIDTSTMESEMQLSLLSALAQNEVESLSQNVSLGVQMKMSRGELMGFNGCLGYDYHPEDKSITINEKEAETVRMIFDLYVQGYGAYTIAKELGSDFPDEYSHSKDTKILRGPNEYAKANASIAIKELIQIASNKAFSENHKDKHSSKAKYGWYRYDTRFAIPKYDNDGELTGYNIFKGRLVIRHAQDGKLYLYDILRIKKEMSAPLE